MVKYTKKQIVIWCECLDGSWGAIGKEYLEGKIEKRQKSESKMNMGKMYAHKLHKKLTAWIKCDMM